MNGKDTPPYVVTENKVIFDYATLYCDTPGKLLRSELFAEIVRRYVDRQLSRKTAMADFIEKAFPDKKGSVEGLTEALVSFFRLVTSHTAQELLELKPDYEEILKDRDLASEFIVSVYNFWRRYERMFYIVSPHQSGEKDTLSYNQFVKSAEQLKYLVLYLGRRAHENLLGVSPFVYRQLPAGANFGALLEYIEWDCPSRYSALKDIPIIRRTLIEPPLICHTKTNTRKGSFEEKSSIPDEAFEINAEEWFCYPAKVGEYTALLYFHRDFVSQGITLSNLFQLATLSDLRGKRPDFIALFGIESSKLPSPTCFFEDKENDMLVGMVERSSERDYFGYFKKLTLTLHNVKSIEKGRLPVHGAMVVVTLKDGSKANIVIIGDSGAGKSETIEAFRVLAEEHISDMKIIFDDMGSVGINENGEVAGYGTETGAFVRLDDLSPGFAFEEIDRSVFMNPSMTNARLVMPITRYRHLVEGYPIHFFLYANNYDQIDEADPLLEFFDNQDSALDIFRKGARMAKGTTDEKGITHSYFANPFGAPQRKEAHIEMEKLYFTKMFDSGVKVGQIRTRLGVAGYETKGPKEASEELFRAIRSLNLVGK